MENTLCVAKELNRMYYEKYGCYMDQMKMHKLMYFSDRESLMRYEEPLFQEVFQGWKYGPVLLSVREEYKYGNMFQGVKGEVSLRTKELLRSVLERYANLNSWKLSQLSHQELSWQYARRNLAPDQNGSVGLSLDMMKLDAQRALLAR